MRFFTIEWWAGEVDDAYSVFNKYNEHLDKILDGLLPDHKLLAKELSLHDARLIKFFADINKQTLTLELDGSATNQSTNSEVRRQFLLSYSKVLTIETTANPDYGLPGPHGYGDLGYDEIDLIKEGLFEHRMLFSTGIVLTVQHADFSLQYTDSNWD